MSIEEWNKIVSENGEVRLIWKGDRGKRKVYVKMKMKGSGRWFVFKGELEFSGWEEDNDN